jgi:hypothetical protein
MVQCFGHFWTKEGGTKMSITKESMMIGNKAEPYINQYFELSAAWDKCGIDIDNASEVQRKKIKDLKKKATEQSGLTNNELTMIKIIRKCNIMTAVNTYVWILYDEFKQSRTV